MQPVIEARTRNAQHSAHRHDPELPSVLVDEAVLYSGSLAKYRAAFLRNTSGLLQGKAELCRSAMQLLDDALSVLLLVVGSPWVFVIHAEAHGVIEQHRNFACSGRYRFGFADTR